MMHSLDYAGFQARTIPRRSSLYDYSKNDILDTDIEGPRGRRNPRRPRNPFYQTV